MLMSKYVSLHWRIRGLRDSLISLFLQRKFLCCFLIALSSKKILGGKNCIALFNLFLGRVCVGVALIDTFSSIAAHHCPDPTFKDKLTWNSHSLRFQNFCPKSLCFDQKMILSQKNLDFYILQGVTIIQHILSMHGMKPFIKNVKPPEDP